MNYYYIINYWKPNGALDHQETVGLHTLFREEAVLEYAEEEAAKNRQIGGYTINETEIKEII
jgi:hypothetical protein